MLRLNCPEDWSWLPCRRFDQQETTEAGQTEKLVGSFTVKSNITGKCDIMVVVVQPDGQVLQKLLGI